MFTWISTYNYDYALAAIPIQVILLAVFGFRRNLPVRASISFLLVMVNNLIMTITDIAACEINEVWTEYPLWIPYGVNIVYFMTFILRSWRLFDYTANECQGYETMGRYTRILTLLPAMLACALILSSPWTAAIFTFVPGVGYQSCALYPTIYYCTYFYLAISLLCVVVCRHRISLRMALSMISYNAILIAGIVLRKLFYHTLVTSYFSILAILVIYIAAQNPDLYRDHTTDLLNADAFDRILSELIFLRKPFCLTVASIYNYASAKATYGHEQLDESLRLAGRWLTETFPKQPAFYFGNGYFMLLHQSDAETESEAAIRALEQRFAQPWVSEDTNVSLQIAALTLPHDALPHDVHLIHDLSHFAFSRAYVENKKGNLVIADSLLGDLDRRTHVQSALGKALSNHRIEVYLQPIYSSREGKVVGGEALARLNDPNLGFVPPDEFVRVAEQTGDIIELGRQIFDRVCAFIEHENLKELGITHINVNLSPAQCMNDQLHRDLSHIAQQHHVPLDFIEFEITESAIEDYHDIQRQLVRLKRRGASFSLDDFGTGTSNLTRLINLPIKTVKLDMTVVWSYFRGESPILPDLVRMFHNAGMAVVVEGVENDEMKRAVEDMGCEFEQGYLFSKPLPPDDFVAYLEQQRAADGPDGQLSMPL